MIEKPQLAAAVDTHRGWTLMVVMVYGVAAATWIFFSDKLLAHLISDSKVLVTFSLYKGWFFVMVTSLLLYWLLRHQQRERLSAYLSQKKQAEEIAQMSLLSAIVNASHDAIYAKDLDGRYILHNPAGSRFVGKPVEEMVGKTDFEIFPAEVATAITEADKLVIKHREVFTLEDDIETPIGLVTFLTIKGPLLDAQGNVVGMFGISRDITERKHTERTMRESEARFRTVFDTMAVGIAILDAADASMVQCNAEAKRQNGFAITVMQQRRTTLAAPFELNDAMDWIRKAAHRGAQHFEWKTQRGAQTIWEDVLLHKVTLDSQERILVITTDITAKKATEEELRRQTRELAEQNRELERFNSAMIGRELAMIELKTQVNELSRQLGRNPPFPTTPHAGVTRPGSGLSP